MIAQESAGSRVKPAVKPPMPTPGLQTALKPAMMLGTIGSLVLLAILVLWAQVTMISGAVIASGQVVVRGQAKMVQNLDGGVVAEILVKNGDRVTEGQVLMRLDPTLLRVNLDIARNRLAEALTQKARLEAEQLGLVSIDFAGLAASSAVRHLEGLPLDRQQTGQEQIFAARREVLLGSAEQLREKILQFRNQRTGVEALLASKREQLTFIESELENVSALNKEGLARESQVLDIQRSQADMLGQIAGHQSELARIANSIRDTELEILQADRTFKEQVVTDLRDVTTKSEELILTIVTTQKQLDRVEMRSPADGVVHEMQVVTVGGVVPAAATVLQIVPLGEGMLFELRLDLRSVDQVFIGQKAKVIFPAFSSRTTPELPGTLSSISPTSILDPATGQSYYRIQVEIAPEELARLGNSELVPGMPVEAFLTTGEQSALTYLIKPLSDQLNRAFREE